MTGQRRSARWAVPTAVLAGLSTLAAGLTVWSVFQVGAAQRRADRGVTAVVADRLSTSLTSITSSLLGVDGLAVDGSVDDREFSAYSNRVLQTGEFAALSFAEVVADGERSGWEQRTGLQMKDVDGAGVFRSSAARPTHVVVRSVVPVTEVSRPLLGLDLLSDRVRAESVATASAAAEVTLSGPVPLATSARPGVFVTMAVRAPDGAVVGFVSSGVSLDDTIDRLSGVPDLGGFGIDLDGVAVAGDRSGPAVSFTLSGRVFTVHAVARQRARWLLPLALGAGTVLLIGATLLAGRRQRRARRRDARLVDRARLLAELAEDLVNAATTTAVMASVVDRAGPIVGARHTTVGRRGPGDPATLQVLPERAVVPGLADGAPTHDLADDAPLAESARTGKPVLLADPHEIEARYPPLAADAAAAGVRAICCTPLSLGRDGTVGAIGFAFDANLEPGDRADIMATAALVGQMAGRAFERALAREIVQERVEMISQFARALTTARSSEDVARCVAYHVPRLLELTAAELSARPRHGDQLRCYPPSSPDGDYVVLSHAPDRVWTSIDETVAVTVVDLIGGALTRTRLTDQEEAVLQKIQDSLLTPAPTVKGYDIAVAYRSALEAIGIGGDWYSVIETADAVHAVIGDIAGHGPAAVALMAEVKTVMRHLLTNGTPIEEAVEHAHRTLLRRNAYASAAVVRIAVDTGDVQYVNAGHPPLLRYSEGQVHEHGLVHRPWLGVHAAAPVRPSALRLHRGDLLLMYTDGLVEDRTEPIDVSIRRQLHRLDAAISPTRLVHELISNRVVRRRPTSVDDDIALIAIKRSA